MALATRAGAVVVMGEETDMGVFTGHQIVAYSASRWRGDDLGPCEVCGKAMPEPYSNGRQRIYRHAEGFYYLCGLDGQSYGHLACLLAGASEAYDTTRWARRGRLKDVPAEVIKSLSIDDCPA